MQKVQVNVVVAGTAFALSPRAIEIAVARLVPEPIRDHYVVVGGRKLPPKQVIGSVTGVDRADFTTNQARAILRRLGFATGRAGSEASQAGAVAAESAAPYGLGQADALRPYIGKWVALAEGSVIASGEAPDDVLAWLRRHGKRGDAMFRVPIDPSIDLGGFPG